MSLWRFRGSSRELLSSIFLSGYLAFGASLFEGVISFFQLFLSGYLVFGASLFEGVISFQEIFFLSDRLLNAFANCLHQIDFYTFAFGSFEVHQKNFLVQFFFSHGPNVAKELEGAPGQLIP